ncbi:MAG TPA: MarR family transcriptional regulator [Steroidobacteraceae bacterium]|jgi:DNA-binding MarR family transcriptional regulator
MVDLTIQPDQSLREAIELFYFAYRAFTAGPDSILNDRGLGRVHHRILYFVGRNPHIAVHALLEILSVSKQALHAPLRQLIKDNLVAVHTARNDRRFKCLLLSQEGKKLEAQLTGTQMKLLAGVFATAGGNSEALWKSIMRAVPEQARHTRLAIGCSHIR